MAIVATHPSVRKDVIETLAKAGKHILLEKPVARTPDEATEIVAICEREGVMLGMLFQHRMRETSRAAVRLVAGGKLGKLGVVEIAVPLWRDQSYYNELGRGTYARDGGGVMITNAIHSIDLALSMTGPATQVQAMTATSSMHQMEAEDFAVAGLRFANGAVGSFVASTAMYPEGGPLSADLLCKSPAGQWMSSSTRRLGSTCFGKLTSPIFRCWDGAGSSVGHCQIGDHREQRS